MKKLILILAAIMVLTFGIAYGSETQNYYNLSINEAVQLGLKNNENIKLAQLEIEKNSVINKRASSQWSNAPDSSMVETKLLSDGYYKRQTEMAVNLARNSKKLIEKKVELGIKNSYYDLSRTIKDADIKKNNVDRVIEQLRLAELKLKLGTGIKQEVLTAQAAVEEAELALTNVKDDIIYKKMEFNKLIGLPFNANVNLKDDVISNMAIQKTEEINLAEKINLAQKNRFEIINAEETYEVKQLYFDIISKYSAQNTYDFREANFEKEKAINQLSDTKQAIELSVTDSFLKMQKANRAVKVYEKNIVSLNEAYRLSKLSYEAGVGVQMEVLNAQNMLYNAELAYIQAVHNFNIAKTAFEASYEIGY